ncbi:MAG: DUF2961 domain-containing protein [Clostridia bacterium]|nr:DUF2961 domain-containing protein [Clostridia bacterium]
MILPDLSTIKHGRTFAFSAENPTGERSGGSKGAPWEKNNAFVRIKPGETLTMMDTDGPGIIQSIWMGGDVCNNLILRIFWDGQDYPSVEVPLPAFFGHGYPGIVQDRAGNYPTLNSAMILAAPCRGMNCYWPMPFRRHCRITLTNRSPAKSKDAYYMITGCYSPVDPDSAYFHATYRMSFPTPTDGVYTILDGVKGCGHYAGVALFAGISGSNDCWVEGEMKIYLDGESFPSVNYTGTEDYFCGSYAFGYDKPEVGRYTPYSGLYAGMYAALGDYVNHYNYQPRFMLYRWHVPDPIFFDESIRVTLQNIHYTPYGSRPRRDDYASTAFWYQNLPGAPLNPLPDDEALDFR